MWGEGKVGVYELAYDVRVAPAPWNRTRVITLTSRCVASGCRGGRDGGPTVFTMSIRTLPQSSVSGVNVDSFNLASWPGVCSLVMLCCAGLATVRVSFDHRLTQK